MKVFALAFAAASMLAFETADAQQDVPKVDVEVAKIQCGKTATFTSIFCPASEGVSASGDGSGGGKGPIAKPAPPVPVAVFQSPIRV